MSTNTTNRYIYKIAKIARKQKIARKTRSGFSESFHGCDFALWSVVTKVVRNQTFDLLPVGRLCRKIVAFDNVEFSDVFPNILIILWFNIFLIGSHFEITYYSF